MDFSRRSLLASFGASGLAALGRPAPPAAPPILPAVDAGRIASRIVSSLQPAPGERAILVYDPLYYPEIAEAIQAGLRAAGANPVVLLRFDPPAIVQAEAAGTIPAAGIEERTVAFLRPLFDQAAMFLWLPARALSNDTRWERLVGGSRAREIHFHWILPLEVTTPTRSRCSRGCTSARSSRPTIRRSRASRTGSSARCAGAACGSPTRAEPICACGSRPTRGSTRTTATCRRREEPRRAARATARWSSPPARCASSPTSRLRKASWSFSWGARR